MMPLDEEQKKELIKKIMEQRKALWEPKTRKPHKEKREKKVELRKIDSDLTGWGRKTNDDQGSEVSGQSIRSKKIGAKLTSEIRKSAELDWKIVIYVILIIIGAIIVGVVIGYLSSRFGMFKSS